jgi:acetylornithine deacetylase/succinyl-diaminopimelate desuccinylase-like protein
VESGMTKTEKLLRDLIALPSVNPAFLPAQHVHAGERRVAEFLAATAAQAGLDLDFQPVAPERGNLLVRLLPRGKTRRRVLLAPHLDTVNAASPDQFSPRVRHGRIYGRGACDTKGSVAAMMMALCQVARTGPRPAETELVFAGLADEENAQAGSRALGGSGLKADLAIVGEPTRLQVVTAHKGSVWLELETRGKAAHGARPELGRNAVHAMARIVDCLETQYANRLRRRRHPLLGCATVSVGAISGGTQANIVPDRCAILVDRRTLPGETETGVGREVRQFLRSRGLSARLTEGRLAPCLPLETDPRLALVAAFLRSSGQAGPAGVHYFCDAAVLAQAGIPSVVFGPGDIAQAHTADEWIARSSLETAQALLAKFLRSLP